jgi:hypothetical protein
LTTFSIPARNDWLLAQFGKEGKPEVAIPNITQETLAAMVGRTRGRIDFFMNRFRQLGFVSYNKECDPMDMKELMEKVRADLRERPKSHFSEVYFRVTADKATSTEVHNALYELLRRDEVAITNGKWRLLK